MKKRILCILLALVMCVGLLPTAALAAETGSLDNFKQAQTYTDGTFTDVKAADWFYKNVVSVYGLELMVGRGGGRFAPDDLMTVAEAMTIAARLHSIYYTGKTEFAKSEPWYQVYTDYCKANGIADPANYDLNKPITRGQFADMFANAFPASALKKINTVQDNMIPDVKTTDKFGAAIYLLYRAGVLVGNDSKGTFAPNSNIKRMEVAAITTRMADTSLRQSIRLVRPSSGGGSYTPHIPSTPTYTVTFDMQGHGTPISPITGVKSGGVITEPSPAPTAEGYTFDGWFKETACVNAWNFATDTVTKDTTLYAKWMKKTIADILPAGFPTSSDGTAPENAWVTEGNGKAFANTSSGGDPRLTFQVGTPTSISLAATVVKDGDNYKWTDDPRSITFVMSDGVLSSIVFAGDSQNSGTYMKMITIADVLATVEGGFPSSSNALTPPENAWTAGDGQSVHFYTDKSTLVFNEPGGTTNGMSASNGVTKSGSDYEYSTSEVTTTFHMTGGKLTSIEYYHDKNHKFDGTYMKMNTIADVLATVEGGFPSSSDEYPPFENAWTTGGYYQYVYFRTDNATLVFTEPGMTTNDVSISNGITKSGSDYKYSSIEVSITFHMTGGKLTSIELGGNPLFAGTYAPQKTVADMLATVEGGFPSSSIPSTPPAGAWTDGQGKTIYANTEGTTVYFKNDLGQSTSMSTTELLIVSGSDYVYGTAYVTITFHMTQGKLTSIEYRGIFPGYDGTYEPQKTVLDMLVTVKDGFPMGMADGWKNGNYSCYYTGTQMLYFSYTKNDFIVSCNTTSVSPALDGNYTCRTANGATATFVMKDKVLSSIVVSGETGDYTAINGEYKPLPTMQVASILATADDFPTEVSKAWHRDDDGDADCYLDTASNSLHIEKMAFNLLTDKVATSTMAKQSGTNWVCKTENNADITFNMSGSKLVSITVANEPTAYVVLNGEYKQTGGHHG